MIRNGIGNIRNDAARRQLEVAAGVRREELNNQAAAMGQNMMAQAGTLPSGILASSPELQRTVMAMANGGPVQRFQRGGGILQNVYDSLRDLGSQANINLPSATVPSPTRFIPPTLDSYEDLRERAKGLGINLPVSTAEDTDETEAFTPDALNPLGQRNLGVDPSPRFVRAQDMGSSRNLNVPDPIVDEAFIPSVSLTDTARDRADQRRAERFDDPQVIPESPVSTVDQDFSQRFLEDKQLTGAMERGFTQQYSPPDFSFLPKFSSKAYADPRIDPRVTGLERDPSKERDPDREFEGVPVVPDADFEGVPTTSQLDTALQQRDDSAGETKPKQAGAYNRSRGQNQINSKQAQDALLKRSREVPDYVPFQDEDILVLEDSDTNKGKDPKDSIDKIVSGLLNIKDKDAGNIILDAFGEKKEEKLEDRIKKYKNIAEDIFGEDIEGEKTERAYNLAFLGFAIASGDSPNALTNISKGLLSATKKFNDSAERKRRRKQKIKEFAVSEGLKDIRDEKDFLRKAQLQEQRLSVSLQKAGIDNAAASKRLAAQLQARRLNTLSRIASAEKRLKDENLSADERARLKREQSELNTMLRSLPSEMVAFYRYTEQNNINISGEQNFNQEFKKFNKNILPALRKRRQQTTGLSGKDALSLETEAKGKQLIKDKYGNKAAESATLQEKVQAARSLAENQEINISRFEKGFKVLGKKEGG